MVVFSDYAISVMYDDETSYATGGVETDGVSLGKVTSFSPTLNDNVQRLLGIGEGRNDTSYIYGNVDVTASIEWTPLHCAAAPARSSSLDFLKYGIGGIAGSGTTAAPYYIVEGNYGYTAATNMLTYALWVKAERGAVDDVDLYQGGIIESWTLTAAQGEALKASANLRFKNVTSSAAITTAYTADTNSPIVYQQGTFKWGATPTTVALVTSFSVTCNNNPQIYRTLGDRFIQAPVEGRRQYDWNVTVKMTDAVATTLRDNFYGQVNSFNTGIDPSTTTADYEIELDCDEGSASGDKRVKIAFDQAVIISMTKPVSLGGGIVEATFSGHAKYAKSYYPIVYYVTT